MTIITKAQVSVVDGVVGPAIPGVGGPELFSSHHELPQDRRWWICFIRNHLGDIGRRVARRTNRDASHEDVGFQVILVDTGYAMLAVDAVVVAVIPGPVQTGVVGICGHLGFDE